MNSDPLPISEDQGLRAEAIDVGYGGPLIIEGLTVAIPTREITAIIGANASGKTTMLRALARLLTPTSGSVILDGKAIQRWPTKEVARRMCLLPQSPRAPAGVTVADLVRRGRYPHQGVFDQWSQEDAEAVDRALDLTSMAQFGERSIDELSGGQRQRAWIAMTLAQETPLMLLDERPSTALLR